jgi:Fungal Zn(2)-Cys(6) binuclear cluster domain
MPTTQKPYACFVCGGNFSRGEHLRRHVRAHANVKPFQCKFCQKRFARKYSSLRRFSIDMLRDVLYRHYGCCKISRAQASLPRTETQRACDRCRKFKSRCSGGIPCDRCRKASQACSTSSGQRSTIIDTEQINRSLTISSTVSVSAPSQIIDNLDSIGIPAPDFNFFPFEKFPETNQPNPQDPFTYNSVHLNGAFDSLDWNFFYSALQDVAAPDSTTLAPDPPDFNFDPWGMGFPGMVESFSRRPPVEEGSLDWTFDGFSLSQLDSFESHRIKILEYLRQSGQLSTFQLSLLSSKNVKVWFHMYFSRFILHSPFIHIPTFNIKKISTSLHFAMLILGAFQNGEQETLELMRVLWPLAESYIWSQATVSPLLMLFDSRMFSPVVHMLWKLYKLYFSFRYSISFL